MDSEKCFEFLYMWSMVNFINSSDISSEHSADGDYWNMKFVSSYAISLIFSSNADLSRG